MGRKSFLFGPRCDEWRGEGGWKWVTWAILGVLDQPGSGVLCLGELPQIRNNCWDGGPLPPTQRRTLGCGRCKLCVFVRAGTGDTVMVLSELLLKWGLNSSPAPGLSSRQSSNGNTLLYRKYTESRISDRQFCGGIFC